MENITETVKYSNKEPIGFINYVFSLDHENKCEIMNMFQYTLLAVIPVMVILKAIKYFIPEDDESKGSLEIVAESIGQILLIVLAVWFTNRLIQYIPTYSECPYSKFNATNFIIPLLIILTTIQTKLGAKLNILIDRIMDLWHGTDSNKKQPKAQQPNTQQPSNMPSQSDYLDPKQILPMNPQMTAMPQYQQQPTAQVALQQPSPDFNQMYQNNTGMIGHENMQGMSEPVAANEIGGTLFGLW
jgi:hypothetical protein